jgi:hypothetical protein
MDVTSELFNYLAIIVPTAICCGVMVLPTPSPRRRILAVVIPALCAVLVVGFGLQGLARDCFDEQPRCQGDEQLVAVHGNTFGVQIACAECISSMSPSVPYILNQYRPAALLACMFVCCCLSSWTLVSFIRWARDSQR